MTRIWLKRFIRFWLVVLLPVAAYLAHQAYELNVTSISSYALADRWLEVQAKHEREGTKGTFDPGASRLEMLENARSAAAKRNTYAVAAGILATSPVWLVLFFTGLSWIWSANPVGKGATGPGGKNDA